MRPKKPAPPPRPEEETQGTRWAAEARTHCNKLTDTEREEVLAAAMRLIYAEPLPSQPADGFQRLRRLPLVDRYRQQCQSPPMKSKPAKAATEPMTIGARMVAKYRPLASQMTKAQREQALARALQLIYGDAEPVRFADRK